jgi:hypothetical protein
MKVRVGPNLTVYIDVFACDISTDPANVNANEIWVDAVEEQEGQGLATSTPFTCTTAEIVRAEAFGIKDFILVNTNVISTLTHIID